MTWHAHWLFTRVASCFRRNCCENNQYQECIHAVIADSHVSRHRTSQNSVFAQLKKHSLSAEMIQWWTLHYSSGITERRCANIRGSGSEKTNTFNRLCMSGRCSCSRHFSISPSQCATKWGCFTQNKQGTMFEYSYKVSYNDLGLQC